MDADDVIRPYFLEEFPARFISKRSPFKNVIIREKSTDFLELLRVAGGLCVGNEQSQRSDSLAKKKFKYLHGDFAIAAEYDPG